MCIRDSGSAAGLQRQVQERGDALPARDHGVDEAVVDIHGLKRRPVSYTHLDVYKRQSLGCWQDPERRRRHRVEYGNEYPSR